ncbi:MAG: hypothetical protein QW320_11180 [Ignisphaera sp.]
MEKMESKHRKGPVVVCPKCGQVGRRTLHKVTVAGRAYYYDAVYHLDGRKCLLGRAQPPKAEAAEELAELQKRLAELQRENEELRRQLAEAEARAHVAQQIFAASLRLGPRELEALKVVYVTKRGYSQDQLATAKGIMHEVIARGMEAGLAVVSFPTPEQLEKLF